MNNETQTALSIDVMYTEACATFRHYSTASMTIRTLSVVQALIVAAATSALIHADSNWQAIATSIFGLTFTLVLYRLHFAYLSNAMQLIESISKQEEQASTLGVGMLCKMFDERKKRMGNCLYGMTVINGPHIFFALVFLCLAIYATYKAFA